ncbi:MAG: hypothetical protein OXT65_08475 [Alphaproteobacteria bacterium]|nr:hypothetical protein [Alphaproteobacteria bacterium]
MRAKNLFLAVLCTGLLVATAVLASTTGSVGSPNVKKGKASVEARLGYSLADNTSSNDKRLRTRVQYDHGLTDIYALRIIAAGNKSKGDNHEADSIGIENRFHLLKAEDHNFDFGLRAGYTFKDGDKKPDAISFGFFERGRPGEWDLRFNQLFKREVGVEQSPGLAAENRVQATHGYADGKHRAGLELFSSFGKLNQLSGYSNQDHTIGPVFKGKLPHGISYETGYRTGISQAAPDHSFKIFLSRGF